MMTTLEENINGGAISRLVKVADEHIKNLREKNQVGIEKFRFIYDSEKSPLLEITMYINGRKIEHDFC